MKIKLRDDIREFQDGLTLAEIASAVSEGLAEGALRQGRRRFARYEHGYRYDCEVEFRPCGRRRQSYIATAPRILWRKR